MLKLVFRLHTTFQPQMNIQVFKNIRNHFCMVKMQAQ